jgi:hypothetical protein
MPASLLFRLFLTPATPHLEHFKADYVPLDGCMIGELATEGSVAPSEQPFCHFDLYKRLSVSPWGDFPRTRVYCLVDPASLNFLSYFFATSNQT